MYVNTVEFFTRKQVGKAHVCSLAHRTNTCALLALGATRIGCGLAGGSWPEYKRALEAFARRNPAVAVAVYKL